MLGKNISHEEKLIVNSYLNENFKKRIFEEYLKKEFKFENFKKNPEDISGQLYYIPRKNSVPLRYYQKDSNTNKIRSSELYIEYNSCLDILRGNIKEVNQTNWLIIRFLLNDNSFFSEPWCPDDIKRIKESLNSAFWKKFEIEISENNDKLISEDLKNSSIVPHEYHANSLLKEEILGSIPNEFSLLEKTIYICKIM